jgi:putative ABC transport system permease protein
MKMLAVAMRNLKRNRKRTLLTIIVVVVSTMGMTFGLSWIEGEKDLFLETGRRGTGDVRITDLDYDLRSKSLDLESNISHSQAERAVSELPMEVVGTGRIRFGGLVYFDEESEKASGTGIEEKDNEIIGFDRFIYEGEFLKGDDEILIGERVRRKLGLKLGDEVALLTATWNKSLYSLNYRVAGFYKMDNTRLNKSFYITLGGAQNLLDMEDRVTEYLIYSRGDEERIKEELVFSMGEEVLIKRWDEIGVNENFSKILPVVQGIFLILFSTLAGFSTSNTMLMVVFERRREIGILKALGMREGEIRRLFLLEGFLMGGTGSLLGVIIGGALAIYLGRVGVDFGDMLEAFTTELNIKGVISPRLTITTVILSLSVGLFTSIVATLLAVAPEVRKEAAMNMRIE